MSLHLLKPMIQEGGYGRKKTARKKARRRRSKNMEERDKYYLWGRRRNGLTDNFTLTIYMQFLVAADTWEETSPHRHSTPTLESLDVTRPETTAQRRLPAPPPLLPQD